MIAVASVTGVRIVTLVPGFLVHATMTVLRPRMCVSVLGHPPTILSGFLAPPLSGGEAGVPIHRGHVGQGGHLIEDDPQSRGVVAGLLPVVLERDLQRIRRSCRQ